MADKTALYENEATQFYADSGDKTQFYGDGETRSEEHGLQVGDELELNHKKYKISHIISQNSGEAVIYGVRDSKDKSFALKMYFEFRRPSDEPNPESLRRILQITDPDLLKLHDFGTGKDKFQGKYCFEISDLAQGGDLLSISDFEEKFTPEFLETKVVPQIFKGIRTLHRNKIFHCDLKPQNVFFRDEDQTNLVIGDYGSAKTFDFENGKDARKTSTVKGTDFYLPPEQARGFISEKNDYYSFGMILLHLVYPNNVCQIGDYARLSRQKLKEIIERQFENQAIIDYADYKGRINDLIAGLTLSNVSNRWGEQEVRKWLSGEVSEIKYRSENRFSAEKKIEPIDLGDRVIQTELDLIDFIENDSEWYEILIEDRTGRDLFNKWLVSIHNLRTKREIDKIIKGNQQYGIEFIQEALLRFFQPYRPITIKNWAYDFAIADDLKFETSRYFGRLLSDYYTLYELRLHLFKYKLALENCPAQNEADSVRSILLECHQKFNPEATTPYPDSDLVDWLGDTVGRLIGKEKAQLCIHFQEVTEDGVFCKVSESLSSYFAERGEDLEVEYTEERTFEYPEYPSEKMEDGSLHFSSAKMYDLTVEHIRKQLITNKPMDFEEFKGFENELHQKNSPIWKKRLEKEEVLIDFQEITKKTMPIEYEDDKYSTYVIKYETKYPKIFLDKQEISLYLPANQSVQEFYAEELNTFMNWRKIKQNVREQFGEKTRIKFTSDSKELVKIILQKYYRRDMIASSLAFIPILVNIIILFTGFEIAEYTGILIGLALVGCLAAGMISRRGLYLGIFIFHFLFSNELDLILQALIPSVTFVIYWIYLYSGYSTSKQYDSHF